MWSGLATPTTPHGNVAWDNKINVPSQNPPPHTYPHHHPHANGYSTASFNKARALSVNAQSNASVFCDSHIDTSMLWQNPNPPKKPAQPDKGTSIWGDPDVQSTIEIRRWKTEGEDIVDVKTSVGQAAVAAAASVPVFSSTASALKTGTTTASTSSSTSHSIWSDSPVAPQPDFNQPLDLSSLLTGWTNSPSSSSPAVDVFSPPATANHHFLTGNALTSDQQQQRPSVGQQQQVVITTSGGSSGLKSTSVWDGTSASGGNNGSVSSNGSGWETATADSILTSAKFNGPINNTGSVFNFPPVSTKLQQSPEKFVSDEQVASLTRKIGDQLKTAVARGYIDLTALQQQQLPEGSLFKLNHLLQNAARLDQVMADLQAIQQTGSLQPTGKQMLDYQRLTNERGHLESSIQILRAQILGPAFASSAGANGAAQSSIIHNQSISSAANGSNSNCTGPGSNQLFTGLTNGGESSLNGSKLFMWKNGWTSTNNHHENQSGGISNRLNECSSPVLNTNTVINDFINASQQTSGGIVPGWVPTPAVKLEDNASTAIWGPPALKVGDQQCGGIRSLPPAIGNSISGTNGRLASSLYGGGGQQPMSAVSMPPPHQRVLPPPHSLPPPPKMAQQAVQSSSSTNAAATGNLQSAFSLFNFENGGIGLNPPNMNLNPNSMNLNPGATTTLQQSSSWMWDGGLRGNGTTGGNGNDFFSQHSRGGSAAHGLGGGDFTIPAASPVPPLQSQHYPWPVPRF